MGSFLTASGGADMGSLVQGALGFIGGRQQLEAQQEDFVSGQQFSAQQAALNRQFQSGQQVQAENFMQQMSDTQMQRRVADLKASGLNPLLAVGQGGASAPTISGQPGSVGSSPGVPNLPNTFAAGTAAYNSAQVAEATARQANAAASKIISETPTPKPPGIDPATGEITSVADRSHQLGDASLAKIQADTNVSLQEANQIKANVDLIGQQIKTVGAQGALALAQATLAGANTSVIRGTLQATIQTAVNEAKIGKAKADVLGDPTWGPVIQGIQALLGPISSAVGAAKGTAILPGVLNR